MYHPNPPAPSRLVLDTNTVLALWMFVDPALADLRTALAGDRYVLCSRADALDELRHVLAYRQFALAAAVQQRLHADYSARCELVAPRQPGIAPLPRCRDGDDQKFLEIASSCGATLLLTRDRALLRLDRHRLIRPRFRILTPERFSAALPTPPNAPES